MSVDREVMAARMGRANRLRMVGPVAEYARQCRCDRPTVMGGDSCFKCGLPVVWVPASDTVRRSFAAATETADRRARWLRTGR